MGHVERVQDYDGYLLRFPGADAARAIVMFHGFPAHRNTRNLDLAIELSRRTQASIYFLHYRGLGESLGDFSFTAAVAEGVALVERVVNREKHTSVALFGASFGGLVALNAAREHAGDVQRVLLASPLLDMSEDAPLFPWLVDGVRKDVAGIFGERSPAEVRADARLLLQNHLPSRFGQELDAELEVTVLQSASDDVTPAEVARRVVPTFAAKTTYEELATDHSFQENRAAVLFEKAALVFA